MSIRDIKSTGKDEKFINKDQDKNEIVYGSVAGTPANTGYSSVEHMDGEVKPVFKNVSSTDVKDTRKKLEIHVNKK